MRRRLAVAGRRRSTRTSRRRPGRWRTTPATGWRRRRSVARTGATTRCCRTRSRGVHGWRDEGMAEVVVVFPRAHGLVVWTDVTGREWRTPLCPEQPWRSDHPAVVTSPGMFEELPVREGILRAGLRYR